MASSLVPVWTVSTADNPPPESILINRLCGLFTAEQWSALMSNVSFRRFVENCTDKDKELVVAYALEVLRKRPSDEPPTLAQGPKN